MSTSGYWNLIKNTIKQWREDNVSVLAAALSYYTIFSLAPFLVLIIMIAGLFIKNAQTQVLGQIQSLIGPSFANGVRPLIQGTQNTGQGILWSVVGFLVIVYSATNLFFHLKQSLDTIWEVRLVKTGIWNMITSRFLDFLVILGIGLGFIVLFFVSIALSVVNQFFTGLFPGFEIVAQVINFVVSAAIVTVLFAILFKVLPDVKIQWKYVWLGAAVTGILFEIATILIGIYLGSRSFSSTYGAGASIIILLLWIYFSAQILFLGAEFTQVYARSQGAYLEPADGAVKISEEEIAQRRAAGKPTQAKSPQRPVGAGALETASPLYQDRLQSIPVTGPAVVQKEPPSPARKSMAALAAIVVTLFGYIGSLIFRRQSC